MSEKTAISLLETISAFANARVAVLGDVMLDRFVFGEVGRISPEAPIPIIRVSHETSMLGGAGNVACNIVRMGGHATLIGALGADSAGALVLSAAAQERGLTPELVQDRERRTIVKTRFVSQGQQLLRVDEESPSDVAAKIADHPTA